MNTQVNDGAAVAADEALLAEGRRSGERGRRSGPRWVALAGLLALAVALCAGCGSSSSGNGGNATAPPPSTGSGGGSAPSTTKIRAAYVPGATFLPAMVAKDAGIFAKHGLDVSLTPTQTLSTIPGALGRQFDIGPAVPPVLIKAVGSGISIVGVAGSSVEVQGDASELIVPANSSIHSIADLGGKRVGTADSGAALHGSTLNWLKQSGVDPTSVTAIEMPFPTMADQLKAGRVDAVEAIQPFSQIMIKAGARSLGAPMLSVHKPRVLSTMWIAQRQWAQDHADVVKSWIASLVEAQALIKSNPTQARSILQKYTQLPPAVTKTVLLPNYDAAMGSAALAANVLPWQQALVRIGVVKSSLPADKFVIAGS